MISGRTIAVWAILGLIAAGQMGLVRIAPMLAGQKPTTFFEVLPLIALLAIPTCAGLAASIAAFGMKPTLHISTPLFLFMIVAGLLLRLAWFGAPAPLEDDFYRYLWDGAVTANGGNPYLVAPMRVEAAASLDPVLARLKAESGDVLARINFPDLTTIYPGTAQLAFAVAHLLRPYSLDGLRAVFLVGDLAALAGLMALVPLTGGSRLFAMLYWLNPMVVFAIFGVVHVDALVVPFIVWAVVAALSARPLTCGALIALAAGVKLWPVLLAPLLLRETFRASPGLAIAALILTAAITGMLVGPLAFSAMAATSGLTAYAASWHINNGPYAWASYCLYLIFGESGLAQRGLRLVVASAAAAVALWVSYWPMPVTSHLKARETTVRALTIAAAVFYLSPAQFPWYALWFLGLAAAVPSFPLLGASVTLAAYYTFYPLWETGRGGLFLYGAAFLHSVPVWLWLAADSLYSQRIKSREFKDQPAS